MENRKRGAKPKGKVLIKWTANFAYAVGLLVADGSLSKDGRHINFTSKDRNLISQFAKCLGVSLNTKVKKSSNGTDAFYVQFSDVLFFKFLNTIGLMPAKSSVIGAVVIPEEFFADFLRGYFDGDGCSFSYFDPKYQSSYRFYISFTSASYTFIFWLKGTLHQRTGVGGHLSHNKNNAYVQLRYAKRDSLALAQFMYYKDRLPCLERKKLKITESLRIISGRRGGEIGRHATFRS